MSAIITDNAIALQRVQDGIQFQAEPMLAGDAPQLLLDKYEVASVWLPSTNYNIGSEIIPTALNRNGRRFVCIAFDGNGRSSDTTEPIWGGILGDGVFLIESTPPGARNWIVSDGNLTWRENGPEIDLWDIKAAIQDGWLQKAALVAGAYDASNPKQSLSRSQMHDHCMKMAQVYEPIGLA